MKTRSISTALLFGAIAGLFCIVAPGCHQKEKEECTKLHSVMEEQHGKYKKVLDDAKDGSDREGVVKALKKTVSEVSDVTVSDPKVKEARDKYVDDLQTMVTALDETATPEKRDKAAKDMSSNNSEADYFRVFVACEKL
jgi:hypothetical protein